MFDTLPGLFIGIAVSLLLVLYRAARPRIAELVKPPGQPHYIDSARVDHPAEIPGVVVLRVESGLFFANSDWVSTRIREAAARQGTRAVILDASNIAGIDVTAVEMLNQVNETLTAEGVRLLIARDIGGVRDVIRRADSDIELQHVYTSVQKAVEAAVS